MTRTNLALLGVLALAAPALALAGADGIPLKKGDVVELDASGLPDAYLGTAKATCRGGRISAVGPEVVTCEQAVRFAAPAGAAKLAYVFHGASPAGATVPVDVPLTRAEKPRTFVAPSDGTLSPPGPGKFSRDAIEAAAREAAQKACGACTGGTGFALQRYEIVEPPATPADAKISVRVRPAAAR